MHYVSLTREIYVAVWKSVKSAQPPRQRWEEESRCLLLWSPEDGRGGTGCTGRVRSDGHTSVCHEKNWYFHIFGLRFAVCAQWSRRKWNVSTVLGVTGVLSASLCCPKKKDILMSRGGSCIVLSGPLSPTGPAPVGQRNLQNLCTTSQIYCKFHTLKPLPSEGGERSQEKNQLDRM